MRRGSRTPTGPTSAPQVPLASLRPDAAEWTGACDGLTAYPVLDIWCASGAGEYNLRLGITKELQPDMVATAARWAGPGRGSLDVVLLLLDTEGR